MCARISSKRSVTNEALRVTGEVRQPEQSDWLKSRCIPRYAGHGGNVMHSSFDIKFRGQRPFGT